MTPSSAGALLGLVAGLGLLTVVARLPRFRRPTLDDRLAPYLRDTPRASRLLAPSAGTPPVLTRLLMPVLSDGGRALGRLLGGREALASRLHRAGRSMTVEAFRQEQLVWALTALLGSLAGSLLLLRAGMVESPAALAILSLTAAVAGVLARDRRLTAAVVRRERQMLAELPTLAELLALSVAAGEGAGPALDRVARVCHGELAGELRSALAAARAGVPLTTALHELSVRTGLPAVARFLDGIVIALERGTPLADVLRAQAVDVRESGKRDLLEAGGRKEIAMMIPVVFVVLPVTVVFALFPGLFGLRFAA